MLLQDWGALGSVPGLSGVTVHLLVLSAREDEGGIGEKWEIITGLRTRQCFESIAPHSEVPGAGPGASAGAGARAGGAAVALYLRTS